MRSLSISSHNYSSATSRSRFYFQCQQTNACCGYTLIELLIALVLVSIGFLGVLSAQSHSLEGSIDISQQVSALQLADDITQRILANRRAAENGAYRYAGAGSGAQLGVCSGSAAISCDGAAIARDDIDEWIYRLQQQLPGGAGLIEYQDAGLMLVTVEWQSANFATPANSNCANEQSENLRCIKLSIQL